MATTPSRFKEKGAARGRPEAASQPQLMREASETIHREHVGREGIDPKRLTYGAVRGMIESLGDEDDAGRLSPREYNVKRHAYAPSSRASAPTSRCATDARW